MHSRKRALRQRGFLLFIEGTHGCFVMTKIIQELFCPSHAFLLMTIRIDDRTITTDGIHGCKFPPVPPLLPVHPAKLIELVRIHELLATEDFTGSRSCEIFPLKNGRLPLPRSLPVILLNA